MHRTSFTFYEAPNFLDDDALIAGDRLSIPWLKHKTKYMAPRPTPQTMQVIFLYLTDKEWKELGILSNLRGSSNVVNGRIVCYGRWHEGMANPRSQHFDEPVKSMSELSIGLYHEWSHGAYRLKGKPDLTHAHMYGYARKVNDDDQTRYAVKPTPFAILNDVLGKDQSVNFFVVSTQKITDQFKKEIKDINTIISPDHKPTETITEKLPETPDTPPVHETSDFITKRHSTPLSDFSWHKNEGNSIVLHTLLGTLEGSYSWLERINLSYNYLIDTNGTVYEQVPPDRAAWHAGVVSQPTKKARNYYGENNPNNNSIGIAFARNGESKLTKAQSGSAAQLIEYLEKRLDKQYTADNIFSHVDITSYKPLEVRNYRSQVLNVLTGEKGGETEQRIREKQSQVLTLMSNWLKNILKSLNN